MTLTELHQMHLDALQDAEQAAAKDLAAKLERVEELKEAAKIAHLRSRAAAKVAKAQAKLSQFYQQFPHLAPR